MSHHPYFDPAQSMVRPTELRHYRTSVTSNWAIMAFVSVSPLGMGAPLRELFLRVPREAEMSRQGAKGKVMQRELISTL